MGVTCAQCLGGLLEEEQLQRWEDLELALSLQKMPDCVYCPRCSSACLEDAENCAQCPKCFFAFCSLCNESWHPGIEVRRLPESLYDRFRHCRLLLHCFRAVLLERAIGKRPEIWHFKVQLRRLTGYFRSCMCGKYTNCMALCENCAVLAQCMSAETKLELLRQRMAGMSVSVAELRRKELEYMSLVRIQVPPWPPLSSPAFPVTTLHAPQQHPSAHF